MLDKGVDCIGHDGCVLAKKTAFVGFAGISWDFVGFVIGDSVPSLLETIGGSSPLESN